MNISHVKSIKLACILCVRCSFRRFLLFKLAFDMDNSDGKASLKQQKSSETTTDTQDASKFY